MAFFNNDTYTSAIPTIEGTQYDVDFGGAANIAMGAYADQLEVVKAIHAADMAELKCKAEYGGACESYDAAAELDRVMEASGGNIFERIRDGIKNFFAKVAKFFKSLYEKFFVYNKSNKSFSEKYSSLVNEMDAGDFPSSWKVTNTYPYVEYSEMATYCEKIADATTGVCDTLRKETEEDIQLLDDTAKGGIDDLEPLTSEEVNKGLVDAFKDAGVIRGTISTDGGSMTDNFYRTLRNGEKGDQSYDLTKLKGELEQLGKFDTKAIKKAEQKTAKDFNAIIKTINSAEKRYKALSSDNAAKTACVKCANVMSAGTTKAKSYVLTFMSVTRTCANEMAQRTKNATVIGLELARKNKKDREKREKSKK